MKFPPVQDFLCEHLNGFKINFKYDETKLNNELILEAKHKTDTETNFSTLLFGLKDNKLEYIKSGFEKVISNINDLQEDGYKTLLAAVINPSIFELKTQALKPVKFFFRVSPIDLYNSGISSVFIRSP